MTVEHVHLAHELHYKLMLLVKFISIYEDSTEACVMRIHIDVHSKMSWFDIHYASVGGASEAYGSWFMCVSVCLSVCVWQHGR